MSMWLAVGIGGAVGSMARHAVNVAVLRALGTPVPFATAIVNIVGCFIIGVLAAALAGGSLRLGDTARAFVFVGLIGGFTTFSSLGLDTLTLVRAGAVSTAMINVAVQFGVGLAAVFLGFWIAR